jgi:hypothetical protein
VVVPAGLYGVGYFLVGPKIGSLPAGIKQKVGDRLTMLNNQVHRIVAPDAQPTAPKPIQHATPVTPPPEETPTTTSTQTGDGGPQVEVSVRSATPTRRTHGTTAGVRPKRKLHRKPKPKPKPEATDEGSYGGTQDQGTTTTGGAGDPPTGG